MSVLAKLQSFFGLREDNIKAVKVLVRSKRAARYFALFFLLFTTFIFAFAVRYNLASLLFPSAATTVATSIYASEDSFVSSKYPTTNYGIKTSVETSDYDSTNIRRTYLKFNLASLAGKTLTSAKLRVTVALTTSVSKTFKIVSPSSWTEKAVNWNNKQSFGSTIGSYSSSKVTLGQTIDIPLNVAKVQGYVGKTFSFGVDNNGTKNNLRFYSKENTTNKPRLILTYSDGTTSTPTPTPTVKPTPTLPPSPPIKAKAAATSISKKVLVLNFDPYVSGSTPLSVYKNWNNINTLHSEYIQDLKDASGNYINYQIVQTQTIRDYPIKVGSTKFTNTQYLNNCAPYTSPSDPFCDDLIDYAKLISEYNFCGRATNNEFDEVWLWGGPWFGYEEWVYAGPDPDSPPPGLYCGSKRFPIMGFNYERAASSMHHSFAHRAENEIALAFGSWQVNQNSAWNRYTLYNKVTPGKASCGKVHYAPNSTGDYDYTNTTLVTSRCEDWPNHPSTTGKTTQINNSSWGNLFEKWWLAHLPNSAGVTNNILNNWWAYIVDHDNAVRPVNSGEKWYTVEPGVNDYNTSCNTNSTNSEIFLGVNSSCSPSANYTANFNFNNIQFAKNMNITDAFLEVVANGNFSNSLSETIVVTDGT